MSNNFEEWFGKNTKRMVDVMRYPEIFDLYKGLLEEAWNHGDTGREGGSWNYRVMVHEVDGETITGIHEVYYDHEGKVINWTENAVTVDSIDGDIEWVLDRMMQATKKTWLDYKTGGEFRTDK